MSSNFSASTPPAPSTVAKVSELLDGLLRHDAKARRIGPTDSLTDAGVSSLDMVNLMLALEASFDVFIPAELIRPSSFRSIASIAAMMDGLQPELASVLA